MSRRFTSLVVTCVFGVALGCSSTTDTGRSHPDGTEQGPCLEGGLCNHGLVCLSHTCVRDDRSGSGGRDGSVEPMGTGGTTGGRGQGGAAGGSGPTLDASIDMDAGARGGTDAGVGSGGAAESGSGNGGTGSGGAPEPDGAAGARDSGCTSASGALERVPLDIYVLFDASQSMNDLVSGGTKWDLIKEALTRFVQSSVSDGVKIGIGYFPFVPSTQAPTQCQQDTDCGQYGPCVVDSTIRSMRVCMKADACNAGNYASDVPIAALPGVSSSIVASLGAHGPSGFTPTYPALQAAYAYLKDFALAHPGDKTILVLSTDGDPTTCDMSLNNVGAIATNLVAPALAGSPSIPTFVIGVGSSLTSLNQIAVAGGTAKALIVDTNGAEAGAQYLDALTAVARSAPLDCEYRVPSLADGGAPDLSGAELEVTRSGRSTHERLGRVTDKAACTQQLGGWYADNGRIVLCDSTCAAIGAAPVTIAKLLFGCGP